MKIGITKYGLPQVVVFPASLILVMAGILVSGLPFRVIIIVEFVLGGALVFILSFFRDPRRTVPEDKGVLVSPADGVVADIEGVGNEFIGGEAIKIGIFLSIFNVHINRMPCAVRVEDIRYKRGRFKDARDHEAGKVNEANDLFLVRLEEPRDRLVVRQISGAIARRIVCGAKQGEKLEAGEKFGMIKFGSRTEFYFPLGSGARCVVKEGDKVKAGETVLVRYEKWQE